MIFPFLTFSAPISAIWQVSVLTPVVSRSKTTYVFGKPGTSSPVAVAFFLAGALFLFEVAASSVFAGALFMSAKYQEWVRPVIVPSASLTMTLHHWSQTSVIWKSRTGETVLPSR